jgi:hypothetical protein
MVMVIESPNCARVPGVPANRARTFRIGSTQSGTSPADTVPAADQNTSTLASNVRIDRSLREAAPG